IYSLHFAGPVPMEDIAKMADECMRDVDDDDDDDNVEDDEDLLVGLTSVSAHCCFWGKQEVTVSTATPGSLQYTLESRVTVYKMALQNAKTAGETSKARRYDRGLKTLQSMLAAVKKGRPVNEAEIPPLVATGAPSADTKPPVPARPAPPVPSPPLPTQHKVTTPPPPVPVIVTVSSEEQQASSVTPPTLSSPSPVEESNVLSPTGPTDGQSESHQFDTVIEALEKGQAVDLSNLPPSPAKMKPPSDQTPAAPAAPRDVLEALEQRRAKYVETSTQAKASGDDRKARMHDRIAKQYQSAIRTHKLGKPVNFDELPVPPGFPPIPGQKATGAEQGLIAALQTADQLASTDLSKVADEEENEEVQHLCQKKSIQSFTGIFQSVFTFHVHPPAAQQLDFLESRRKQYMKAALQAKHKNDMEQAKALLRTAKGLDPMIEAARSGRSVDISTVPSPPGDEDEDFVVVHHNDVAISEKAEKVYSQLTKILKEQYEKCLTHSKQFTHLGNVAETTKFEKMAESCKKSLELLKLSESKGLPPPPHHFEERSFCTVGIFPELSSTDMVVVIVKAMNLPAPSGIQTNDLDAYVKFDFPYPSSEQPQKHKTTVIKNTNSPEYNQSFTLSINRNHRGFRRVVTSKGLKLELLHKGGFLRSDKPIGTALVKLDKLESQSEIREIVEVIDGRKRTGGRVEVKVRLREPLSGQDVQKSTERWLSRGVKLILVQWPKTDQFDHFQREY
uniref:Coiled-coil and C2 domain-containing protein 1B n=1 Tax=Gouania willdenowi TaxID=441366 RepID=A0A8C5GR45_GOUWI